MIRVKPIAELIDEVRKQGIRNKEGLLERPIFDLVVDSIPIVCVDFLPVHPDLSELRVGIITRATGPERDKPALLGGRVQKDETIAAAIGRHLFGSLGEQEFAYHEGNSEGRPFYVAQYDHDSKTFPGFDGYDPTKHSIGLTYLIDINEPTVVRDEASDFRWVGLDQIPEGPSAYNHHVVMQKAADFLGQLRLGSAGWYNLANYEDF